MKEEIKTHMFATSVIIGGFAFVFTIMNIICQLTGV